MRANEVTSRPMGFLWYTRPVTRLTCNRESRKRVYEEAMMVLFLGLFPRMRASDRRSGEQPGPQAPRNRARARHHHLLAGYQNSFSHTHSWPVTTFPYMTVIPVRPRVVCVRRRRENEILVVGWILESKSLPSANPLALTHRSLTILDGWSWRT